MPLWIVVLIVVVAAFCVANRLLAWYEPRERGAPFVHEYEGTHLWGEWSEPYEARYPGHVEMWQGRRCQCGNRDFRRAKDVNA